MPQLKTYTYQNINNPRIKIVIEAYEEYQAYDLLYEQTFARDYKLINP